jgi:hypothetical protein
VHAFGPVKILILKFVEFLVEHGLFVLAFYGFSYIQAVDMCWFSVKWKAGASPLVSIAPFPAGPLCTAQRSGGYGAAAELQLASKGDQVAWSHSPQPCTGL